MIRPNGYYDTAPGQCLATPDIGASMEDGGTKVTIFSCQLVNLTRLMTIIPAENQPKIHRRYCLERTILS